MMGEIVTFDFLIVKLPSSIWMTADISTSLALLWMLIKLWLWGISSESTLVESQQSFLLEETTHKL